MCYSIIIAIGYVISEDKDPDIALLKIESDPEFIFEDVYDETRDLEDFGIIVTNLNAGIYRVQFELPESKAVNIRITPVSWPDCEPLY